MYDINFLCYLGTAVIVIVNLLVLVDKMHQSMTYSLKVTPILKTFV